MGQVRAQSARLPRRVLEVLSREEINRLEDVARSERDRVARPHSGIGQQAHDDPR